MFFTEFGIIFYMKLYVPHSIIQDLQVFLYSYISVSDTYVLKE
jgi:hypothetical protein